MKEINSSLHYIKANLFLILLFISVSTNAQEYFQQEVNFKIDVTLDDTEHSLKAFATIEYINNSPNELSFIWFHLWPNGYKNAKTALAQQFAENKRDVMLKAVNSTYNAYHTGYIDSLDFKVNGGPVEWQYHPKHIDICKLILNEPLKSGEKIQITTPFYVKIPSGNISRLGHVGQTYQITQWYPKPAVYDKNGWHEMPYLNMGEFYSEFGSFDVSITLPQNYVVAASGSLQTKSEVEWLNQKAKQTAALKDSSEIKWYYYPSSDTLKTIRYTLNNTHDFAWFADKSFYVLKGEVELPHSKNKVTSWAMFTKHESHLWLKSIDYINDALYYYSLWNGDYPYKNCTALQSALSAGGGMEYPTITVIGTSGNDISLEQVIMHEVGHNWFYAILGFDERRYPFLDEGINSANELRYMETKYPDMNMGEMMNIPQRVQEFLGIESFPSRSFYDMIHDASAGMNWDQPADLHSSEFSEINYGAIVYMKMAGVFNTLRYYLGDEVFDKTMQKFYDEWKFKHPYPDDLRKTFERTTDKNLDWFFDDLISTTKKADYALCRVKNNKALIKNKGDTPVPFPVFFDDDKQNIEWYNGFEGKKWITLPDGVKNAGKIQIDKGFMIYEQNRQNNIYDAGKLFHKIEPVKLKLLGSWDNPSVSELYLAPALGYNTGDKFMAGVLLHNSFFPKKTIEYMFMPMFSTGQKNIAGASHIEYHVLPYSKVFEDITLRLAAKQYGYSFQFGENISEGSYRQMRGDVEIIFRKRNYRKLIHNLLNFSVINADEPMNSVGMSSLNSTTYYTATYRFINNRMINPFDYKLRFEAANNGMLKLLTEFNFTKSYKSKNKGFDVRLFFGQIINNGDFTAGAQVRLDGTSGSSDYLLNYTFVNRFDDFNQYSSHLFTHQFVKNEGGFTAYAPGLASGNRLVSLNLSTTLPKLPLAAYANLAVAGLKGYAEAGVELRLLKGIASVYLPLAVSNDIQNQLDIHTDSYVQRLRFTLNMHKLNIFEVLNNPLLIMNR